MKIAFTSGLTLRQGERCFELVRQISSDEYQFEDCLTRRPFVAKQSEILKKILSKTYSVVFQSQVLNPEKPDEIAIIPFDLNSLPLKTIKELERRLAYVRAIEKAHITRGERKKIAPLIGTVAKRIQDKKPPSASALMGWIRKYHLSQYNPLSLVSGNLYRKRQKRIHPLILELVGRVIRNEYLKSSQNSQRHCIDHIKKEIELLIQQGRIPSNQSSFSLASLSRTINDIDIYSRIAKRESVARARMVCRTTMNGAGASYPLERVEIDHTPLNWVVICDRTGLPLGRPLLTVILDAFSNYVLGIYLSFYGPGVTSVSGVLRNAIMPKDLFVSEVELEHSWIAAGIPDEALIDNGLEFHSSIFKSMAWQLGMSLTYCRVRTPWLKPHVERFFAELDYLSLSRGRIRKKVPNVVNIDPKIDAAITFSDLVKGLIMFVADVHPFSISERKLARPYDLMMEGLERCPPVSFPTDLDSLRLTTALGKEMTVGPGGVEIRGLPYGREELLLMHKRYGTKFKAMIKWDPDDMAKIWVQDPIDKTWVESPCRWSDYAIGLSWNQHLIIRKFARNN